MRRACLAFRVKLSRDTGLDLPAAVCESLLGAAFTGEGEGGEEVTLQSNTGLFYAGLGEAIRDQALPFVLLDHEKVAWWCFREAAEVHKHPVGMRFLAGSLILGQGVTEDPVQAVVWYQKAADLGDAAAKVKFGAFLMTGDPRAGVAEDAVRGLELFREADDQGHDMALYLVAQCYLNGKGVEKDAAYGVSLLRQVINREDATKSKAERTLTICYMNGNGVEVDTVQAALWCQKAVMSGNEQAIELLSIIRECDFCGSTPARQLCVRCLKLAHWHRETDPHKGPCKEHCRRATEASQPEVGGASTSAHH